MPVYVTDIKVTMAAIHQNFVGLARAVRLISTRAYPDL